MIAYAKANPGKLSIGHRHRHHAHVAGELFKMTAGIDMTSCAYRGGAPMMTDLIGGQVQVAVDVCRPSRTSSPAPSGRWRTAGASDTTGCPMFRTIGETNAAVCRQFMVRHRRAARHTREVITRLNHEINAGLRDPKVKERLATLPPRRCSSRRAVRNLHRFRDRQMGQGGSRRHQVQ